jgi:hypothetical protein
MEEEDMEDEEEEEEEEEKEKETKPGMVHTCNPSTGKAGRSQVQSQSGLYSKG